ncbi:unnamed protein product [Haemonchus placei]|uniref:NFACT-R_1 domain-containing protein n=1 Tax=Haemonchus placei TaxID=6290 RepID=A0A158QLR4_HAEPC|nr:unnamed protein product [Haemonchus placei]
MCVRKKKLKDSETKGRTDLSGRPSQTPQTPLPPPAPTKTLTEEGGSIRQEGKSSDIQAKGEDLSGMHSSVSGQKTDAFWTIFLESNLFRELQKGLSLFYLETQIPSCIYLVVIPDDKREPLQIKVPPPRVLKARRAMVEVKEARDPLYKTLEPDMSEWESVRLLKKSEVNLEELLRKGSKYEDVTQH